MQTGRQSMVSSACRCLRMWTGRCKPRIFYREYMLQTEKTR
jgi:hypothetical protein